MPRTLATRRGPSTLTLVAVVVLVLFAGAVGFGVYRAQAGAGALPAGATAAGVAVGNPDAPVTIDLYLDFQCPACAQYEQQAGATIDELVASGRARVVYHPVAYLNRFSSTQYSSRSSAAAGCAADAGVLPRFAQLLYANQPPEGGDGLPDEQLVALGTQAGAGLGFATCVQDGRYAAWTRSVTDAASRAGITATPTVLVNGREVERTAEALRAAVDAG
ncbi:protein-disulfide isomerase [Pseudonocardia hierapolitana]|uniref:Protein-disulfide isomerase n=1 Tax=Pseudonocardia hierapolitana TaxID=1128676 RepID=A0A561T3Z9_9PSEU|nr:thioredoxin domain-containing protein [Pseudonocardia hierapolitana]TWF81841.1 protein-disulfide isomerase [Pseudonocardia hierapolitana]